MYRRLEELQDMPKQEDRIWHFTWCLDYWRDWLHTNLKGYTTGYTQQEIQLRYQYRLRCILEEVGLI